ncbi:hypothetical protein AAVH_09568 [Aphelenchoides avenae]|nr:hypothetical protein AAVH_09568 [Aphelenchus avenae]
MLKPVFRRYGGLRCVEVDYDGLTGRSTREACVTFAGPEQVQAVLKYFGGYYLRNGEAVVSLPMDRLNRELERPAAPRILPPADSSASILAGAALPDLLTDSVIHVTANADRLSCELKRTATAGTASVSAASDSASPKTAISDLLTDSVIHVTAKMQPLDPSVDLIDLSNPSPPPMHSAVISPAEVGYIYAEKREYEIPVHFYAVTESEKLEIATQICSTGGNEEQDANNNESDERYTKVTFVVRSTSELVEATRRINAAGMDCFTCVDPSIRGGHSFHRSEFMTVNVTIAPVCGKIKFSQHVVFLSPIDDPEDMGAAMDVMMLERTDVNLVSVLFDESNEDERHQVSLMLNLLR